MFATCELSLEKLLPCCRSRLQKSMPSFPAALSNGDNIGDFHNNSLMPEKPLQGSFPQALQGGRQAAAVRLIQWKNGKADLTEKQG